MPEKKTTTTTLRADADLLAAARRELADSAMTLTAAHGIFLEAIVRDGALETITRLKGGDAR